MYGPTASNRHQAIRMHDIYCEKPSQRILNYRPKPCRPIHCHLLPPTPSAIDLSWASAKG